MLSVETCRAVIEKRHQPLSYEVLLNQRNPRLVMVGERHPFKLPSIAKLLLIAGGTEEARCYRMPPDTEYRDYGGKGGIWEVDEAARLLGLAHETFMFDTSYLKEPALKNYWYLHFPQIEFGSATGHYLWKNVFCRSQAKKPNTR